MKRTINFFLLFINFTYNSIICSKSIKIPFINTGSYYSITFQLGKSNISTLIDLKKEGIVVDKYDSSISESSVLINNKSYQTYFGTFEYFEYKDYINFFTIDPIPIIFSFQDDSSIFIPDTSGFGLGYNSTINELSLTSQLKSKDLIDKNAFTIIPFEVNVSNNKYGSLYFGEIPRNLINKKKYKGNCISISNSTKWSCNLTKISFKNYTFVNNYGSYFQTSFKSLIVPHEFLEVLFDNFLVDYKKNKKCIQTSAFGFALSFECDCETVKNLPDLEFTFGDTIFTIKFEYFFSKNNDKCFLDIIHDFIKGNEFAFGTVFMNLFITHFDYDNKLISFYSDDVIIKDINENKLTKYFLHILTIWIIFGMVILVLNSICLKTQKVK